MLAWGKRHLLVIAALMLLAVPAQAQQVLIEALRKENDLLRVERDALLKDKVELQQKLAELQNEDRSELEKARLEIDVLRTKLDRLTQRLEDYHRLQREQNAAAATEGRGGSDGVTRANHVERIVGKPAESLKGKITEVSESAALLALSIGSEDGAAAGQELECYRLGSLDPKDNNPPLYLGKVRILRVTTKQAVAQYLPPRGMERRPMVGDDVASDLLPK
jgi:hypothetical protein